MKDYSCLISDNVRERINEEWFIDLFNVLDIWVDLARNNQEIKQIYDNVENNLLKDYGYDSFENIFDNGLNEDFDSFLLELLNTLNDIFDIEISYE